MSTLFPGSRPPAGPPAQVVSVSVFVRQLRQSLERGFPLGWVGGEVSNLVRAGSGHVYFTLKDQDAQLRCTLWRSKAQLLPFQLQDGMRVEVRAQVTIYEPRGDLQLSVENVRRAGQGNLFEAFMRLKSELEAQGLFSPELKRPLPALPRCVGIVTSPAAAALQDVITTLRRRAPGLRMILYPTRVQGDAAGAEIADALDLANDRQEEDGIEALLLCRGGGSLEDLWAFNEEAVVRAIRRSRMPVICGVGHETDTSLADFAADVRAPTPTAAAEMISAGLFELRQRIPRLAADLQQAFERHIARHAQKLDLLERRLIHPGERLARHRAHVDQLDLRLQHAASRQHAARQGQLHALAARLERKTPDLHARQARLDALSDRLRSALERLHGSRRARLAQLEASLCHLNPRAVLERGYAIVRGEAGDVVRSATQLKPGARVQLVLAEGQASAEVHDTSS